MEEEERFRYFVTNHQNQPLELHLASGVIVLGAREEVEVQEADLATPQIGALRQNRLVTTRAASETPQAKRSKASQAKSPKTPPTKPPKTPRRGKRRKEE